MSLRFTNLYDLATRCYWLDSKLFNQSEWKCVNFLARDYIVFTQNRTCSWGLTSLYIALRLYLNLARRRRFWMRIRTTGNAYTVFITYMYISYHTTRY